MEDHHHHHQGKASGKEGREPNSSPNSSGGSSSSVDRSSTEPVRSRWIPKPEQILILESIFNSGMVNPPKEETVRIRKLLEKFGAVGDANVFYWFQNRRSRSRRRQRQLQASLEQRNQEAAVAANSAANLGCANQYEMAAAATSLSSTPAGGGTGGETIFGGPGEAIRYHQDDVHVGGAGDPRQFLIGFPEIHDHEQEQHSLTVTSASSCSDLNLFQSGVNNNNELGGGGDAPHSNVRMMMMTVFINGVATEVPRGPLDMKAMFGTQDVLLVHSSGLPLPINEFGFLAHSLHPGESYFLVSRNS